MARIKLAPRPPPAPPLPALVETPRGKLQAKTKADEELSTETFLQARNPVLVQFTGSAFERRTGLEYVQKTEVRLLAC